MRSKAQRSGLLNLQVFVDLFVHHSSPVLFLVSCQVDPSKMGGYISLESSSPPHTSCCYSDPSQQVVFSLVVSQLTFTVICRDCHKTPGSFVIIEIKILERLSERQNN